LTKNLTNINLRKEAFSGGKHVRREGFGLPIGNPINNQKARDGGSQIEYCCDRC